MPKNIFSRSIILLLVMFTAGCQTTQNTEIRAYKQAKERVDQKIEGNAGNWQASPQAENTSTKPTRMMYILEVTKNLEDDPAYDSALEDVTKSLSAADSAYPVSPTRRKSDVSLSPKVNIPAIDDVDSKFSSSSSASEYTVEKDDTLQKISKKFYDSYSKWPKIYEANRSRIKNPDRLQPGTVLSIPAE